MKWHRRLPHSLVFRQVLVLNIHRYHRSPYSSSLRSSHFPTSRQIGRFSFLLLFLIRQPGSQGGVGESRRDFSADAQGGSRLAPETQIRRAARCFQRTRRRQTCPGEVQSERGTFTRATCILFEFFIFL